MKCKAVTLKGHTIDTEVHLFATDEEAMQYVLDDAKKHGISDLRPMSGKAWEGDFNVDTIEWEIHDVELSKHSSKAKV